MFFFQITALSTEWPSLRQNRTERQDQSHWKQQQLGSDIHDPPLPWLCVCLLAWLLWVFSGFFPGAQWQTLRNAVTCSTQLGTGKWKQVGHSKGREREKRQQCCRRPWQKWRAVFWRFLCGSILQMASTNLKGASMRIDTFCPLWSHYFQFLKLQRCPGFTNSCVLKFQAK